MTSIKETAERFFEAFETGKGWEGCKGFCHPNATFSCQADAVAEIDSLQSYAYWMKGLALLMPDGSYEMGVIAVDESKNKVIGHAVFRGTHTGEVRPGGVRPAPSTGMSTEGGYVYVMSSMVVEFGT